MSKSKTVVEKATAPEPTTETQVTEQTPAETPETGEAPVAETEAKETTALETETAVEQETPKEPELPVAKEPTPVEKAPEPPVAAEEVPRARNPKHRKGLVKANVNVPTNPVAVFSLEGIVKHKHGFDLAEADAQLKEVIEFLDSYEERMNPNINIEDLVGESLQKQLFKNYLKILGLPALERGVGLEVLLWKFFENNNQVWRVNNLSRYTRNGKWNIAELQMFVQLSNLFNHIKDPAERIARVRTIKLGATVAKFPGEKAKYTEALIAWATSLK